MNTHALLGPLDLQLTTLSKPIQEHNVLSLLGIKASISTAFTEVTVDNLCLEYRDFLLFRKRLRLLSDRNEQYCGWHSLMPMLDLSLTWHYENYVRAEVRITPNMRGERHTYDFDTTIEDVTRFARDLDIALLSSALSTTQA